jgi:hypothetical protein
MKYQFKEGDRITYIGNPIKTAMQDRGIVFEHLTKESKKEYLIAEMKEVLTHIPDNKLAG